MKKIIFIFILALCFTSCDTSVKNIDGVLKEKTAKRKSNDTPIASVKSLVKPPAESPRQKTVSAKPKDIVYKGSDVAPIKSPIAGSENLKGIDCTGFSSENLAKQVDEFVSDLYKTSYEEYSIGKRSIASMKEQEIDTTSYDDAVFIYFGPSSKKGKYYEAYVIEKNTKKTTDYFVIERTKNKLTINKPATVNSYPESLSDSRILVLKNNKCYIIGLHGMTKTELTAINNEKRLNEKVEWILTTPKAQGGLLEVAKLDNSLKSKKLKVKAVYEYMIENVSYMEYEYCPYIYGALVLKKAVCQGYAVAFNHLLSKLGFKEDEYKYIVGGNHAWNHVKLGDQWYHVDTTWGDIPAKYYKDAGIKNARYNHFLKSDDCARKWRHTVSTDYCTDTKYDSIKSQNKLKWGDWTTEY